MNRKPQEADCLRRVKGQDCGDQSCRYHTHERTCGGEFIKTKEPEPKEKSSGKGRGKKRDAVVLTNASDEGGAASGTPSIRDVFGSTAKKARTTDGASSSVSPSSSALRSISNGVQDVPVHAGKRQPDSSDAAGLGRVGKQARVGSASNSAGSLAGPAYAAEGRASAQAGSRAAFAANGEDTAAETSREPGRAAKRAKPDASPGGVICLDDSESSEGEDHDAHDQNIPPGAGNKRHAASARAPGSPADGAGRGQEVTGAESGGPGPVTAGGHVAAEGSAAPTGGGATPDPEERRQACAAAAVRRLALRASEGDLVTN
jgi:hypothetical protein